jgi:hypothetical protein
MTSIATLEALNARILANALTHAHEPSTWDASDERMREPDEGEAVDERHEQMRVDDVLSERWGR